MTFAFWVSRPPTDSSCLGKLHSLLVKGFSTTGLGAVTLPGVIALRLRTTLLISATKRSKPPFEIQETLVPRVRNLNGNQHVQNILAVLGSQKLLSI